MVFQSMVWFSQIPSEQNAYILPSLADSLAGVRAFEDTIPNHTSSTTPYVAAAPTPGAAPIPDAQRIPTPTVEDHQSDGLDFNRREGQSSFHVS